MDPKFIVIGGVVPGSRRLLLYPFHHRSREGTVLTREPGGTPLAEGLRRVLFDKQATDLRVALSLIKAARIDHEERVIIPALERGEDVICDSLDYASLVPIVDVAVHEESIMHAGFNREWMKKKPTLLILILPPEESHYSVVVRNIGHQMNCGISSHETEVVYIDSADPDNMVNTVHQAIAAHLHIEMAI